jgi:hypothetical protein
MNMGITRVITLSVVGILPLVPFCRTVPDGTAKAAEPGQTKPASPSNLLEVAVYDADPEHLWNRLYAALYVRTTDDGQSYGQGELDPLLWENSTYLLTGPRYQLVLRLMDELLDKRGEKLIAHPLQKALFQHDLWAVFDWLADTYVEHDSTTAHLGSRRRALRNRLAPIIRRLALSAQQIDKLPDNYRVALAREAYPPKQDPAHTERAFLPRDLFDANGPWVHFQTGGRKPYPFGKPTALTHVHFVGGRSTFFVFMNLPGGRQSTLDFMEKLNAFPKPGAPHASRTTGLTSISEVRPQPPSGTKLALVRQMMLIDDRGEMRPTRLIESVQIRIVHPMNEKHNDFYEFTLDRKELFNSTDGLRAGKSDQVTFPLFNHTHDGDIFEFPNRLRIIREAAAKRGREEPITENLRSGCVSCHKHSEIVSTTAFFHDQPAGLTASERANEVERVVSWKREKYQWGLLQGLTEDRQVGSAWRKPGPRPSVSND